MEGITQIVKSKTLMLLYVIKVMHIYLLKELWKMLEQEQM